MRRHFYFRPHLGRDLFDAWDVARLIECASSLPVRQVPLESLAEIDEVYWVGADGSAPTVRVIVRHMELCRDADLHFPIILASDGRVMDGMHRVARAMFEGRHSIDAVRFEHDPPADLVGVRLEDISLDE